MLSAKQHLEVMGPSVMIPGKFKASDTYYQGALLVFDVNGFLAVPGGAATDIPAGMYTGHGIDPGDAGLVVGAGENPDGVAEKGLIWVPFSGAAQSDVGELFYLAGDDTVTKTAGTNAYGLMCLGYKAGFVLLDFNNLVKV